MTPRAGSRPSTFAGLAALIALALPMIGCTTGEIVEFQNRAGTLLSVRVSALNGRTLEIVHEDTEREKRSGQERFVARPAANTRGISADQRTFGPIRVNPDEVLTFRVLSDEEAPADARTPTLVFEVARVLSMGENAVSRDFFDPLPSFISVTRRGEETLVFEVPVDYDPAPPVVEPVPESEPAPELVSEPAPVAPGAANPS